MKQSKRRIRLVYNGLAAVILEPFIEPVVVGAMVSILLAICRVL